MSEEMEMYWNEENFLSNFMVYMLDPEEVMP